MYILACRPWALQAVRQELYDALVKVEPTKDWSFVTKQIGMFRWGLGPANRRAPRGRELAEGQAWVVHTCLAYGHSWAWRLARPGSGAAATHLTLSTPLM